MACIGMYNKKMTYAFINKTTNSKYMKNLLYCLFFVLAACGTDTPPPAPFGPVPTPAQLAWQEMEMNAFVHFNMNTFTNMEWGTGAESPALFNPSALDCRQWARICRDAGMKGIILTAKHHDGFCLWPSSLTEHSVKNAPWKNGQGDVVRELADACKEYGLKMGIYLSPWDRNHADYGKPEYLDYFRGQLRELLTGYGDLFEVWFDGANGGTGWYGGANEERTVDRQNYYDWPTTNALVAELQPNAVIFSDAGPGVRWVGNENGYAGETNWSTLRSDEFYPGSPNYEELTAGHADGTHWVPAECDVSIRPGWYYHPEQDTAVKSLKEMVDIYYHSVGRNGLLLLNLPVDKRGWVHEADERQLRQLAEVIRTDFAEDLASGKTVTASNERGKSFTAQNALDGHSETFWATADGIHAASIEIDLGNTTSINRLVMQEYIRLGQRVESFRVFVQKSGDWELLAAGTTVGYKRILRFENQTTDKVKIEFAAKAPPCISKIGIYAAPELEAGL